jgi:hypothetical protein
VIKAACAGSETKDRAKAVERAAATRFMFTSRNKNPFSQQDDFKQYLYQQDFLIIFFYLAFHDRYIHKFL